jgi:hypothetical protein
MSGHVASRTLDSSEWEITTSLRGFAGPDGQCLNSS